MTRTVIRASFVASACAAMLYALPAHAQRVFVSGSGSDSNPCSYAEPCRTFAQAFNTVAANGEIDVLDAAGYGPLTITHGISIQGHGFAGITESTNNGSAISITAGTSDAVTLNGLIIEGPGGSATGISIVTAGAVQILDCVIRYFGNGTGINYRPTNSSADLLVSDTVVSDNDSGISIQPVNGDTKTPVTLSGITANNNNGSGVAVNAGYVMVTASVMSNNNTGLIDTGGSIWLANSVVSGNVTGVYQEAGIVNTYGDNDINSNSIADLSGSLTPTGMR